MQKRYCSCGKEVWVQYLVKRKGVRFWTLSLRKGHSIDHCPECGGQLAVDHLK